MYLALDNLTSGTTLIAALGNTSCAPPAGSPYVRVNVGTEDVFTPRERVNVDLQFVSATAAITYQSRVLAGSGAR